jgi:hypothetical protein
MNGRIQELAVQADLLIKKNNGDMFRYGNFDPRFQKFAELIVRECIAQCEKNAEHEWLGSGSKLSAFNIKQHFGVEE